MHTLHIQNMHKSHNIGIIYMFNPLKLSVLGKNTAIFAL